MTCQALTKAGVPCGKPAKRQVMVRWYGSRGAFFHFRSQQIRFYCLRHAREIAVQY